MQKIKKGQINALKYLIFMSKNIGEKGKKICFALINASNNLTEPVCFDSTAKDCVLIHDGMASMNGSTHIHEIFRAIGTNFRLYVVCHKEGKATAFLANPKNEKGIKKISKRSVNSTKLKNTLLK